MKSVHKKTIMFIMSFLVIVTIGLTCNAKEALGFKSTWEDYISKRRELCYFRYKENK